MSRNPPSGIVPDASKKQYCSHWIRTGECDYTQVGCVFKHEMPDPETLRRIGFTKYPHWWLNTQPSTVAAGGRNPDGIARSAFVPVTPKTPNGPAAGDDIPPRPKAPVRFGNCRSHPDLVLDAEIVGRPPVSKATVDKLPEKMEKLSLGQQELRGMNIRREAKEGSPTGRRLGSPVDLLLEIDPYPFARDSYEARLPASCKTAAILPESEPEMPTPVASAKPSERPLTYVVPRSPKSPPPFRRFFETSGNGAVGDGRKVKTGANGASGQPEDKGKATSVGNGTVHPVGNGIAHPSGNGVTNSAKNGIARPSKNAVVPTARNDLVPTSRKAAPLGISLDGVRSSRYATAVQRQQPQRRLHQRMGGRELGAPRQGVTFQGLSDEDEEQDGQN
jgi:hypothetical protein